ncbi:hypothetical protein JCM10212_002046 [Sporobolomyces blumeae]
MPRPGSKRPPSRSPSHTFAPHLVERANGRPLAVEAHEATLLPREYAHLARETLSTKDEGGRLAKWHGTQDEMDEPIWVDRYDILNLLSTLPSNLVSSTHPHPSTTASRSAQLHLKTRGAARRDDPRTEASVFNAATTTTTTESKEGGSRDARGRDEDEEDEVGFSDLGSDHEELFYFTPSERAEVERVKKRRRLERGREERIRELDRRDQAERTPTVEDETEPSDTQLLLMRKLHQTLLSASNPSLLEMRILTQRAGTDPRFDFLRNGGRWRDVWDRIRKGEVVKTRDEVRQEEADGKTKRARAGGLGGLVGYGSDSDSESDPDVAEGLSAPRGATLESLAKEADHEGLEGTAGEAPGDGDGRAGQDLPVGEEEERKKKELKAEKARAWAEKRRLAREGAGVAV